jgi:hypothetical protein
MPTSRMPLRFQPHPACLFFLDIPWISHDGSMVWRWFGNGWCLSFRWLDRIPGSRMILTAAAGVEKEIIFDIIRLFIILNKKYRR